MVAQSNMNQASLQATMTPDLSAQLKEICEMLRNNGRDINTLRTDVHALGKKLQPQSEDSDETSTMTTPPRMATNDDDTRDMETTDINAVREHESPGNRIVPETVPEPTGPSHSGLVHITALQNIKEKHEAQITALRDEVEGLRVELQKHQELSTQLSSMISPIREEVNRLKETRVVTRKAEVKNLRAELEALRAELKDVNTKHQAEVKTLQTELEALRAQVKDLRTKDQAVKASNVQPLPAKPPYDNCQGHNFDEWKHVMVHNLMVLGDSLGSKHDKWIWLWSNMSQHLQSKVAMEFAKGGPLRNFDVADFLEYLGEPKARLCNNNNIFHF
jgi:DNA repair exonuclease SbcCD ATPase subunit